MCSIYSLIEQKAVEIYSQILIRNYTLEPTDVQGNKSFAYRSIYS